MPYYTSAYLSPTISRTFNLPIISAIDVNRASRMMATPGDFDFAFTPLFKPLEIGSGGGGPAPRPSAGQVWPRQS